MTLGERLKFLRGGESQTSFGKKIGVSQSSLSTYELDSRAPDATTLQVICKLYKVSPEWLLFGTGPTYRELSADNGEEKKETSDMSDVLDSREYTQHVENIDLEINKMSDMSDVRGIQREIFDFFREQNRLVRENAELLVALEQTKLEVERKNLLIERRDMRIHELEKENAGLREERKGVALICRTSARDAG